MASVVARCLLSLSLLSGAAASCRKKEHRCNAGGCCSGLTCAATGKNGLAGMECQQFTAPATSDAAEVTYQCNSPSDEYSSGANSFTSSTGETSFCPAGSACFNTNPATSTADICSSQIVSSQKGCRVQGHRCAAGSCCGTNTEGTPLVCTRKHGNAEPVCEMQDWCAENPTECEHQGKGLNSAWGWVPKKTFKKVGKDVEKMGVGIVKSPVKLAKDSVKVVHHPVKDIKKIGKIGKSIATMPYKVGKAGVKAVKHPKKALKKVGHATANAGHAAAHVIRHPMDGLKDMHKMHKWTWHHKVKALALAGAIAGTGGEAAAEIGAEAAEGEEAKVAEKEGGEAAEKEKEQAAEKTKEAKEKVTEEDAKCKSFCASPQRRLQGDGRTDCPPCNFFEGRRDKNQKFKKDILDDVDETDDDMEETKDVAEGVQHIEQGTIDELLADDDAVHDPVFTPGRREKFSTEKKNMQMGPLKTSRKFEYLSEGVVFRSGATWVSGMLLGTSVVWAAVAGWRLMSRRTDQANEETQISESGRLLEA